ncbi:MAG: SIMPL domain-containing protein [Ilumatobacteraceae bacterium]
MSGDGQRTVTVTGAASTSVRPDRASLSLGVQCRRSSAEGAMGVANERAGAVVAALRDAGAGDDDLRTTGINLWYDQSERHYVASYSLTVDVPVDEVGRRLDVAATAAGDEFSLNGVSFSVADPAPALAPLRKLALADARAKATTLAAAEGATVGDVVTIIEGGGGGVVPMPKGMMRMMAAPIEAGTDTLTLQVTATYELI